jgi:hypothetical protein
MKYDSGLNELLTDPRIIYVVNVHMIWDFAQDVYYYVLGCGTVSKESTASIFKVGPQDSEDTLLRKSSIHLQEYTSLATIPEIWKWKFIFNKADIMKFVLIKQFFFCLVTNAAVYGVKNV